MSISAFFLLLTAVVYIFLWDKHNVHGWTVSCHVSSMFFLYVFLATSYFLGQYLFFGLPPVLEEQVNGSDFEYRVSNESEHVIEEGSEDLVLESKACTVIGMRFECARPKKGIFWWLFCQICFQFTGGIAHFFFISTFCWLTLLNFDLWATFKSTKPAGERSKGIVRFGLYNVFAWGFPALVVAVSYAMDHIYS